MPANMSSNIRSFFGNKSSGNKKQGGGDVEKAEKQIEKKRKQTQNEYDKTKRIRVLKESWLKEYSWAVYDEHENALYCEVCRKFPNISDSKSALVQGLRQGYRKETLKFHDKNFKT